MGVQFTFCLEKQTTRCISNTKQIPERNNLLQWWIHGKSEIFVLKWPPNCYSDHIEMFNLKFYFIRDISTAVVCKNGRMLLLSTYIYFVGTIVYLSIDFGILRVETLADLLLILRGLMQTEFFSNRWIESLIFLEKKKRESFLF